MIRPSIPITRRTALAGIATTFAISTKARAAEKIVVYTVIPEAEVNRRINEEFTRRTGIEVEVLNIPAVGTVASRIRSEKDRPRADVFAAATTDFLDGLANDGLLVEYRSPSTTPEMLARGYVDAKGFWHGWYGLTTCIFWNTGDFAKRVGGNPPASWDDLLAPAMKGHVIMSNPQTSAIGYVLLAIQIFRSGEEKAWEYTKALGANVAQWTPSAPLTVTLVERGEGAVGAFWLADVLTAKIGRKQPIEFVVPPQNTVAVWAASIVKGGPNTEGAKKYIDYLMTDFPQTVNAEYGYRSPLNPAAIAPEGAPALSSVQTVKYDQAWATANIDRVRKKWAEVTGA